MTYRVVDERRRTIAEDKDLEALKRRLAPTMRARLAKAGQDLERRGLRRWDFGELPRVFEQGRIRAYPALVDEGDSVAIRMFETEDEQRRAMWAGTRRLLLLASPAPAKQILGTLGNQQKLALSHNPHGSASALFDDCAECAVDKLMADAGGVAWTRDGFTRLHDHVRAELYDTMAHVVGMAERILTAWYSASTRLQSMTATAPAPALEPALDDIAEQLESLIHPGFITETGYARLADLLRYIRAIDRRLEKLPDDPHRDAERMHVVHDLEDDYHDLLDRLPPGRRDDADVLRIRWMLEELRVSFFAQTLGTPYPVSEKRIRKAMDQITA